MFCVSIYTLMVQLSSRLFKNILRALFKNLDLNLNDSESFIGFYGLPLQNWSKLPDVFY